MAIPEQGGQSQKAYVEHPLDLIVDFKFGTPVALVTIKQSQASEWNLSLLDPPATVGEFEHTPTLVPGNGFGGFDSDNVDPEYATADPSTTISWDPPGAADIALPAVIDKTQYLKTQANPQANPPVPSSPGTGLYYVGRKFIPTPGGGGGQINADQFAWIDVGLISDTECPNNPASKRDFEADTAFLSTPPFNGTPIPSDFDNPYPQSSFTGNTRQLIGTESCGDGSCTSRLVLGQAEVLIQPAQSFGDPGQGAFDYFLVNFAIAKKVAVIFGGQIIDPTVPPEIAYWKTVRDYANPVQDICSDIVPPLPLPSCFATGQQPPCSIYISSTDVRETVTFTLPARNADQSATVRIQLYSSGTKFFVDTDNSVRAINSSGNPADTPPVPSLDVTKSVPYPAPDNFNVEITGATFTAKGFG